MDEATKARDPLPARALRTPTSFLAVAGSDAEASLIQEG
jgi:hypothetical protein